MAQDEQTPGDADAGDAGAGDVVELTVPAVSGYLGVVRTATAEEYTAGQRLYGLVDGDLLWTFDKAAGGHPLQNHLWARLRRV